MQRGEFSTQRHTDGKRTERYFNKCQHGKTFSGEDKVTTENVLKLNVERLQDVVKVDDSVT